MASKKEKKTENLIGININTKHEKKKRKLSKVRESKKTKTKCSFKDVVRIACPKDSKEPNRFVRNILYQDDVELHGDNNVEDHEALEILLEEANAMIKEAETKSTAATQTPTRIKSPKKKHKPIPPDTETNKSFQTFQTSSGQLLLLEENATVYLHGLINITPIYGRVNILGRNIDRNVDVFSPRGSAHLSIVNRNIVDDKINLLKYSDVVDVETMGKKALILCEQVKNPIVDFMVANTVQVMYPAVENGLQCRFFENGDDASVFNSSEEWDQIVDCLRDDSRVILCGGRGLGKSTLLRFLINRSLDRFERILVVDLDPGQPEFTIPGCVSATIVRNALLGPNYTHLQQPERCFLVPDINVAADCENYLLSVKELLISCNDLPQMPTIVNYMGYTKGLGVNLVSAVIGEVRPNLVVQIEGIFSKNFPDDLSIDNVKHHKTLFDCAQPDIEYKLLRVKSAKIDNNNWEIEPRFVRELLILAYIGQILPSGCNYLTNKSVPLFRTKLSQVKIINNGKRCNPMAANANLVALCRYDNNLFKCFGWGIVRGVCLERDLLLLLTPVHENVLENIEYLVLNVVNLPPAVYLRHDNNVNGIVPYVYEGKITNFAQAPKRLPVFKK